MVYEIYKMNEINDNITIPASIDGFIFFYSSEDRSCNVLKRLAQKKKLPNKILALSFLNIEEKLKNELQTTHGIEITEVIISKDLAEDLHVCLIRINEYVKSCNKIGIDISCMVTPIFAQLIKFLTAVKGHNLMVYYTEPAHYDLENLFDFSAYKGEIDIKAIPGFMGKTARISEAKRVVFYILGFELNYLNQLIPQEANPDDIVPINGFPSYFPKFKDISLINNNSNYHERDIKIIFAHANNPFDTYNQLDSLMNSEKWSKYCIDILPAGSKPMALGACLFALAKGNDVRLLFPFPSKYKINQSKGSGIIWEYQI